MCRGGGFEEEEMKGDRNICRGGRPINKSGV